MPIQSSSVTTTLHSVFKLLILPHFRAKKKRPSHLSLSPPQGSGDLARDFEGAALVIEKVKSLLISSLESGKAGVGDDNDENTFSSFYFKDLKVCTSFFLSSRVLGFCVHHPFRDP